MVASLQIGTAASYYARGYYHGGERLLAATWFARAAQFGVQDGGAVDIDQFTQLHAGLDADGKQLLTTSGRTVEGIDFTFSPGKSVSLAYALTTDNDLRQAILTAHHKAVRAALAVLEDEAIFARRGHNGLVREKVNVTAALFTHDTARPEQHLDGAVFADPQIHTHSVIFNLALRPSDGTIGGIDTRLGPIKLCIGGIYHAHAAYELSRLGFAIREIGRNGMFEVGFDPTVRKYFSARRDQIVEELAEIGLDTASAPALAAAAAIKTRRGKEDDVGDERFSLWQMKARELGLEADQCVEHLRNKANERTLADERAFAAALASVPTRLTENEATFSRKDLIRAVANAYVGTSIDPAGLLRNVNQLIKTEAVFEVRRDQLNEPIYSTPEMIRLEREAIDLARKLADQPWRGVDAKGLQKKILAQGLSAEQADVAATLGGGQALALLEGKAGTGKNRTLTPLIAQLRDEGYRVILAATAWRTVEMGIAELDGVEGRALDSWRTIAQTGGKFIDDRTVLIVDEAGQLGVRATHAILREALRCGGSGGQPKIILCGDSAQLKPIAAGAGIELVRVSAEGAVLNKVVRQRDRAMRGVVEQLSRGEVATAYGTLETKGCVVDTADRKIAVSTAVDKWFAAQNERPGVSHLLIARANTTVRALNNEVRKRLRRDGQLQGENVIVRAATASGDPFNLALAIGDRIRFGRRVQTIGRGVINGTTAGVEHIERDGDGHARITARIGRERVSFSTSEIADENHRVRLAHNYATTIYASQGLTAESCTILVDPSFDRHDLYVAASRARGQTTLVVDNGAIDALVIADRPYAARKNEVTSDERRAKLLSRLSRLREKTTTLEPGEIAEHAKRQATCDGSRQQRAKKELGREL